MRLGPAALLLLLAAAPALAASGSTTVVVRTYEAAGLLVHLSLPDPAGVTQDGSLDVGGFVVPGSQNPVGGSLLDIQLRDAASPHVRALACEDLNGDAACGDPAQGEPRAEFCDDLAHRISDDGVPFYGGVPLTVFVFAAPLRTSVASPEATGPAPCPDGSLGFATSGVATLTFAGP